MKKSYSIPVRDVAEYFLSKIDDEVGDCITNLKLQKLVYYAQGFVMALTGKKLFDEKIVAWEHGPVVEELYQVYKHHKSNCIKPNRKADISSIENNEELANILDEVYAQYGQFSAWKLRGMTHEEAPWKETGANKAITDKKMLNFFNTLITAF